MIVSDQRKVTGHTIQKMSTIQNCTGQQIIKLGV